jgi:hypothetical protein
MPAAPNPAPAKRLRISLPSASFVNLINQPDILVRKNYLGYDELTLTITIDLELSFQIFNFPLSLVMAISLPIFVLQEIPYNDLQ